MQTTFRGLLRVRVTLRGNEDNPKAHITKCQEPRVLLCSPPPPPPLCALRGKAWVQEWSCGEVLSIPLHSPTSVYNSPDRIFLRQNHNSVLSSSKVMWVLLNYIWYSKTVRIRFYHVNVHKHICVMYIISYLRYVTHNVIV